MSRAHRRINARTMLAGAVAIAVVLSLLPGSALRWLRPMEMLAETLVSPVQGPLHAVWQWVRGGVGEEATDEQIAALKQQGDEYQRMFLQEQARNEELRRMVAELQSGRAVEMNQSVSLLLASVIGRSDARTLDLKVKAGTDDGVELNTVGAVRGVHLVGRVVRVLDDVCFVRVITDKASDPINAVVMADATRVGQICHLVPEGDGTLKGPVGDERLPVEATDAPVEVGMLVRLRDQYWPESASMLVVGQIEKVEPREDYPLRKVITVRPVLDLSRVGQVMLRIPEHAGSGGGGAGVRP